MRFLLDFTSKKFRLEIISNIAGQPAPQFYERHYYMPITAARVINNPSLKENPGYQ